MKISPPGDALGIALVLLLFCATWLLGTELLVLKLTGSSWSPAALRQVRLGMGLGFALGATVLLYWLVHAALEQVRDRERASRQARDQLRHLLEASPVILYALRLPGDAAPRLQAVSDNVNRLLGYSADEALAEDWWLARVHPDDRAEALAGIQALAQQERSVQEYRVLDRQGQVRWMRNTARRAAAAQDPAGIEVIGSWLDISDRHAEEERQALLTAVFTDMKDGLLILDEDFKVRAANPALARSFGQPLDALLGSPAAHLKALRACNGDWLAAARDALWRDGSWQGEVQLCLPQGGCLPFWVTASAVLEPRGKRRRYVLHYQDISALRRQEEALEHLAHYDALTDLPNRLLLREQLTQCLLTAQSKQLRLAVLHLDLDDFKSVNDSLGHGTGDALLRSVSARLRAQAASESLLARPGSDEFLLVTAIASVEEAQARARDLLGSLKPPFLLANGRELFVEACLGMSLYPDHGRDADTLLRRAETALYRAKQQGPARWKVFSPRMASQVAERLDLVTALRRAVERHELLLHYQPRHAVADGRLVGAEALLRWRRPGVGLVLPDQFIALAEVSGLISPIGEAVIDMAIGQLRLWLDRGLAPGPVSINVSARQFRDQNLAELLGAALRRHQVPARLLEIEITESLLLEQPDRVLDTLASLRALGLRVAVDDFGTGFSSFSYLTRLPADLLKIDTGFIAKIGRSSRDDKVVSALIEIAQHLGLQVVAEGVEHKAQLDFLRQRGCDFCQGFLFSPALPSRVFAGQLAEN